MELYCIMFYLGYIILISYPSMSLKAFPPKQPLWFGPPRKCLRLQELCSLGARYFLKSFLFLLPNRPLLLEPCRYVLVLQYGLLITDQPFYERNVWEVYNQVGYLEFVLLFPPCLFKGRLNGLGLRIALDYASYLCGGYSKPIKELYYGGLKDIENWKTR